MAKLLDDGEFIPVADVLNYLYDRLEPIPDVEPTFLTLTKRFLIGEKHYKDEELNHADVDLLISIFNDAGLDFNGFKRCTPGQYELFKKAFETSKLKPEWTMSVMFQNHQAEAKTRRGKAKNEYLNVIDRLIKNGSIKVYTPTNRIPLNKVEYDSVLSREDADKYLKEFGYTLNNSADDWPDYLKGPSEYEIAFNYGRTIANIRKEAGNLVFDVNLHHWLSLPEWTPEQAVCLLYGFDYNKLDNHQCLGLLVEKLQKAKFKGNMTPYQWQQFGVEQKFPLPKQMMLIEKLSLESQTETLGGNKADAGAGNHAITEPKKPELSKLEKQKEAILNVIKAKKFKPMEIPDNEKGTIKLICQSDYSKLFEAETAFDRAWKEGINKLWRMEHHESYAKRGNN
jgi:hypothetical protein